MVRVRIPSYPRACDDVDRWLLAHPVTAVATCTAALLPWFWLLIFVVGAAFGDVR